MDINTYDKSRYDKKGGVVPFVTHPRITSNIIDRHIGKAIPLMELCEINYVEELCKNIDIVFEWGGGGSTLYFSQFVKGWISIESERLWYELVRSKIKNKNNIFLYYEHDTQKYVDYIDNMRHGFDIIIVDGRWRVACAEKALSSYSDIPILFHDYFNHIEYHTIEDKYDLCIEKPTDGNMAIIKRGDVN